MVSLISKKPQALAFIIICFGGLFYLSGQQLIANVYGQEENPIPRIAIFYGSKNDKQLCEEMVSEVDVHPDFFNISNVSF